MDPLIRTVSGHQQTDETPGWVVNTGPRATVQVHSAPDGYLGLATKFSRFIIVAVQEFTQRNLDRFGATWLLNEGKWVRMVDLSLAAWGRGRTIVGQPDAVAGVLRPSSWESFGEFLKRHGPDSLALLYASPDTALPLFELVARSGVSTLYFDSGRIPIGRGHVRRISTIVRSLPSYPKRLLVRARRSLLARSRPRFGIDYLVMSGEDCKLNPPVWLEHARVVVPSHSYDYVIWERSAPFVHSSPYIVFLDQAYPEHADPVKLGLRNPFNREVYYPEVEGFLRYVSTKFRMPVLVALHPRAPHDDGAGPYRGFPTFRGCTAPLVKGARVVVAHDTTAISFAVLGRKPLLLVNVDEMTQWKAGQLIRDFACVLGAPVTHVRSRDLPVLEDLDVKESKYAWYERMYVRHPWCNGVHVWDRVFGFPQRQMERSP